jgi:hypothetical protein
MDIYPRSVKERTIARWLIVVINLTSIVLLFMTIDILRSAIFEVPRMVIMKMIILKRWVTAGKFLLSEYQSIRQPVQNLPNLPWRTSEEVSLHTTRV